jgi:Sec-independent protein secretion pathway component TatC
MKSIIFFCFGLFFGYWFHFARMYVHLMMAQKTLKEAEELMHSVQTDMDKMVLDTRAIFGEEQWNEDKL